MTTTWKFLTLFWFAVRVPASSTRGGDWKPELEDWTCRDDRQRRFGKSDRHRRKTSNKSAQRLSPVVTITVQKVNADGARTKTPTADTKWNKNVVLKDQILLVIYKISDMLYFKLGFLSSISFPLVSIWKFDHLFTHFKHFYLRVFTHPVSLIQLGTINDETHPKIHGIT